MPGGRPLVLKVKYETLEKLQEAIDDYFVQCDEKEVPYTITGLALALGIDRNTLNNYSKRGNEEFLSTIKNAKTRVENSMEVGLVGGKLNSAGCIFNLKNNFGWLDERQVKEEKTVKIEGVIEGIFKQAAQIESSPAIVHDFDEDDEESD